MKFWLVLFSFCVAAFAQFMTLSDFAFMLSQKEKLNIVFDKSVDKNITVFISSQSTSTNYLELLNAVLKANNLDSFRVSDTVVISQSKVNDVTPANFHSSNNFSGSNVPNSPFSEKYNENNSTLVRVTSGDRVLNSYSFPNTTSTSCTDCVYEPLKLNFLNISDLTDFLKFSGAKYHYVKNINTIIFEAKKDDNSTVQKLYDVIKTLDIPKQQVQLRLTIFENNLNKLSDIGFNPSLTVDFSALSRSGALFHADMVGKFYGSLRFLETNNATKVTNTPSFLVSNLEKLEFKSVVNIPFLDENFAYSYQGTNQSKKYKYKAVGFKVDIVPTIVDDFVYLDLNLAFENVASGGDLPTTTEKSIKNKFMLRRGEIMLLAGIDKSSFLHTKEGLPFLGNIPVLGSLFSHDNKNEISETFNISIEVVDENK